MTLRRALAAVQTVPVRGDVAANLARHVALARAASAAGARVIVFPELSLTGYELDLAAALAFDESDPRLEPLREAAAACAATLVAGAPVRLGPRLHVGAFLLDPDGGVALYTKRRLGAFTPAANPGGRVPPAEATVFAPGDRDPLLRAGDGDAAVAICADIGAPEHAASAAARGARTYLASMFVIPGDFESDAAQLAGYAARHAMAVVFANYGGPSGGLPSAGRSAIWSAAGERLVACGPRGEGFVVAIEEAGGWRCAAHPADGAAAGDP